MMFPVDTVKTRLHRLQPGVRCLVWSPARVISGLCFLPTFDRRQPRILGRSMRSRLSLKKRTRWRCFVELVWSRWVPAPRMPFTSHRTSRQKSPLISQRLRLTTPLVRSEDTCLPSCCTVCSCVLYCSNCCRRSCGHYVSRGYNEPHRGRETTHANARIELPYVSILVLLLPLSSWHLTGTRSQARRYSVQLGSSAMKGSSLSTDHFRTKSS